ncbi:MAG: hypothetical protein JNM18_18060, partial [Planctomycetaceae bacterium]|nr:hypothetical protein [Planctomycetaceae bacterium]
MNLRHSQIRRRVASSSINSARQRRLGFETLEARYALVGDFQSAVQLLYAQNILDSIRTAYDSSGNLFVSGTYSNDVNFDPTNSPGSPYTVSTLAGFLAKYTTTGTLLWVHTFDAGVVSEITSLAVDSNDNANIVGRIRGTQDFDFTSGTTSLTTYDTNTDCAFVAQYSSSGALGWALKGD